MNCPKCGYAMGPFDTECERCKRMGAEARRSARRRQVHADTTLQGALHSPLPRPVCYALIALLALSVPVSWAVDHRKEEARKRAVAQANANAMAQVEAEDRKRAEAERIARKAEDARTAAVVQAGQEAHDRRWALDQMVAHVGAQVGDAGANKSYGQETIAGNMRAGFVGSGRIYTTSWGHPTYFYWQATLTNVGDHWEVDGKVQKVPLW